MPLKVGWFSTANGPGSLGMLEAVLHAIDSRKLDAELEFVFVNRERGQTTATDRFMDIVESNGVPLIALSSRRFRKEHGNPPWASLRKEFDRAVLDRISDYAPDVCMQAGYMLYAPLLCDALPMLNQHPALPGRAIGMWQDAVWNCIESRAVETGSMVHVSTADLDRGPVVSLCRFPIVGSQWETLWKDAATRPSDATVRAALERDDPFFNAIRRAGLLRERPLVVRTLAAIANGEVPLDAIRSGNVGTPIDLTDAVESDVAAHLSRVASQAD